MELGSHDIVAPDDGGDLAAIVDMGETLGRDADPELVGMHEIGVLAAFDACKNRVRMIDDQIVPAHMGHLKRAVLRRDGGDFAVDPAEAGRFTIFQPASRQHLHADADAKERYSASGHRLGYRLGHAGDGVKCRTASREGAVAWQYARRGLVLVPGSVSEDDLMVAALDAGAEDIVDDDGTWQVLTDPSDLPDVRVALEAAGIPFDSADVTMLAETTVPITEPDKARTVLGLIDQLDDHDDVQNVYANFDASTEVLEAVGG